MVEPATPLNPATATNQQPATTNAARTPLLDLVSKIKTALEAVTSARKNLVVHAIIAGDALLEAKATMGHGEWGPWLEKYCSLSERTAQRFMSLAKNKARLQSKSANLADLKLTEAEKLLFNDDDAARDTGKGHGGSYRGLNTSDSYDKAEKKLIDRLKALSLEEAEAAAEDTIKQLKSTVATMKAGAKNVSARAA
jgi:hypothetical protein